jgi:hypothetical protein
MEIGELLLSCWSCSIWFKDNFANIASSHSSVGRASHCNQTGCHRPKQLLRMSPVRSGLRGFIFCGFLRCVAPSIRAQGNIFVFCHHSIRVEGMKSSSPPFLTLDSISFASIWEACACFNRLEKLLSIQFCPLRVRRHRVVNSVVYMLLHASSRYLTHWRLRYVMMGNSLERSQGL